MPTLQELLAARRPAVIADCVRLVDAEVAAKSGLSGLAVKGAFAVVKKVKPGIIREAVDALLDDFVARLAPFFDAYQHARPALGFGSFLGNQAAQVASALLGVTDARVQRSDHRTIRMSYEKLRPTGQRHVEAAVPGIGRVLDAHLPR
jgi:hypothetical protein